jgi:hypothetical protein
LLRTPILPLFSKVYALYKCSGSEGGVVRDFDGDELKHETIAKVLYVDTTSGQKVKPFYLSKQNVWEISDPVSGAVIDTLSCEEFHQRCVPVAVALRSNNKKSGKR